MVSQKQQTIVFALLLVTVGILVLLIWLPFLKLLALGAILAVLFHPVYKRLAVRFKSPGWAAFATIILIILVVLGPLYLFGQVLFNEVVGLYGHYKAGDLVFSKDAFVQNLPPQIQNWAADFLNDISLRLSSLAGGAFASAQSIISNVTTFVISLVLVMFTTYYLLKDGAKLKDYVDPIMPLSEEKGNVLAERIDMAISGIIKGQFLVGLAQGIVGTIGFLIFGVPQAFLWGLFTFLAALVPTFGTSLALIPAVLYLLITGHTGQGIGMAIWGIFAVGLIDNFMAPKLIGSRTNLHPLLVLFSVIGGLQFFGVLGFLLGPILMAVFMALLDTYRKDIKGAI
jgi:predicted PurR-regulated permease PerM